MMCVEKETLKDRHEYLLIELQYLNSKINSAPEYPENLFKQKEDLMQEISEVEYVLRTMSFYE